MCSMHDGKSIIRLPVQVVCSEKCIRADLTTQTVFYESLLNQVLSAVKYEKKSVKLSVNLTISGRQF